ncbi:alpha/beta fold hydrolase [Streptomyces sp. NBC_00105]|uniref:alpha/beta fold hydrolase n=1 Tax=Streptomyces sp. NBC_00105 TaxID=2903622 RepID=UPI003251AFB5
MFKVVSSDGTVIACERHGDAGPTLLLVGGTLMPRARHAPLAALLARDFTSSTTTAGAAATAATTPTTTYSARSTTWTR